MEAAFEGRDEMEAIKRVGILEEVLIQHPQWATELAESKNKGSSGYDITNPECKAVFRKHMYLCGRYQLRQGAPIHISATAVVIYANDHHLIDEYQNYFEKHKLQYVESLDMQGFKRAISDLCLLLELPNITADPKKLSDAFSVWDKNKDGTLSLMEFNEYCRHRFGSSRKIVMKFMKNKVNQCSLFC